MSFEHSDGSYAGAKGNLTRARRALDEATHISASESSTTCACLLTVTADCPLVALQKKISEGGALITFHAAHARCTSRKASPRPTIVIGDLFGHFCAAGKERKRDPACLKQHQMSHTQLILAQHRSPPTTHLPLPPLPPQLQYRLAPPLCIALARRAGAQQ